MCTSRSLDTGVSGLKLAFSPFAKMAKGVPKKKRGNPKLTDKEFSHHHKINSALESADIEHCFILFISLDLRNVLLHVAKLAFIARR